MTDKLNEIKELCEKQQVRCPASAAQASVKSFALAILEIIEKEKEITRDDIWE